VAQEPHSERNLYGPPIKLYQKPSTQSARMFLTFLPREPVSLPPQGRISTLGWTFFLSIISGREEEEKKRLSLFFILPNPLI